MKAYKLRGQKVRMIRLRKKRWRQADLARAAGISIGQISRLEAGKHTPQLRTISRIAEALGVEFDDIVEWNVYQEE